MITTLLIGAGVLWLISRKHNSISGIGYGYRLFGGNSGYDGNWREGFKKIYIPDDIKERVWEIFDV